MTSQTYLTPVVTPQSAPPDRRRSVTAWSVRHRWWVLLGALVVVVTGAGLFIGLGITTTDPDEQLVGDSAAAERIVSSADFGEPVTEQVVITRRAGRFTEADVRSVAAVLQATYADIEHVEGVLPPMLGTDRRTVVAPVAIAADDDPTSARPEPAAVVRPMLEATERLAADHPEWQVGQIGDGSVQVQLDETYGADFKRAELYSLPLTLLILLIAFGAVVAAGVPLLLGLASVAVAFGVTAVASHAGVAIDPNAQSLVLLIGLAVGVDYALFVLRRSREERAAGATPDEAVIRAGRTAGRAVVISGITVMVAVSGMLVAGGLFTSLAIGTVIVIGAAVLGSVTVLPALLAVLGDRVDRLRVPLLGRLSRSRNADGSAWARLAGRVTRRPRGWALVSGGLLLALALPGLSMKTSLFGIESLPQDLPVVDTYRRLAAAMPEDGTALWLVVQAPADRAREVSRALSAAGADAVSIDHVSAVAPTVQASVDGRVSVLQIGVDLTDSSKQLPGVVERVRAQIAEPLADELGPDAAVHIGGAAAGTDLAGWMDQRLPWVVGFVLTLTLLVMLLSFGSPSLAVATIMLNALSVGAAYGVLTLVFQHDWAESLLAFNSVGSIAAWLPLLMFVVLFGLSMDYHIFVTSRVREAYAAGADARTAVRLGVARSAGVVTSAAAVMVGVFAIFGTLSALEMKQLGVGLATAILLDATVVRGVLLPAVLAWLGDRAHRGPRWLPTLHTEGSS